MYRLENWYVISASSISNTAVEPETESCKLVGTAFGNEAFDDGDIITTSRIVSRKDGIAVTFSNNKYLLGEVLPAYEDEFSNARARFFSVCKEEDKVEDKTPWQKFLEEESVKCNGKWRMASPLTMAFRAWSASRSQTRDEICELIHKLAKRHEPFTPFIITAEINRKIKPDN